MIVYAYPPAGMPPAQFAGLSLSKLTTWIKNHKREVIGGAVVLGGAALAARTAGGWSALRTKAGWSNIGNALVGTGSKALATVKGVDLGRAVASTATVLTTAAALKGGGQAAPDSASQLPEGLVYGPQNPVPGGGATVSVDGEMPEPGGMPGWLPWTLFGVAVVGFLWAMSRSGARRVAVAA